MPERRDINVDLLLEPPITMRDSMDDEKLRDLAADIRKHGVLQNLVVVPDNGKYEIVAGHRRYIAAKIAGLVAVPCLICDNLGDAKYAAMMAENGFREDVTPAGEGMFFLDLAEKHGWSEEQICVHVGRSADYINERVKLVRDFPVVMEAVRVRKVNWSQAKAIMRCKMPKWIPYLIEQATTHGATARTITNMVDQLKIQEAVGAVTPAPHTPEHAPVFLEPAKEVCTWCQRNDDQANMTKLPVHSYHVKDLQEFLRATGLASWNTPSRPTDPQAA